MRGTKWVVTNRALDAQGLKNELATGFRVRSKGCPGGYASVGSEALRAYLGRFHGSLKGRPGVLYVHGHANTTVADAQRHIDGLRSRYRVCRALLFAWPAGSWVQYARSRDNAQASGPQLAGLLRQLTLARWDRPKLSLVAQSLGNGVLQAALMGHQGDPTELLGAFHSVVVAAGDLPLDDHRPFVRRLAEAGVRVLVLTNEADAALLALPGARRLGERREDDPRVTHPLVRYESVTGRLQDSGLARSHTYVWHPGVRYRGGLAEVVRAHVLG